MCLLPFLHVYRVPHTSKLWTELLRSIRKYLFKNQSIWAATRLARLVFIAYLSYFFIFLVLCVCDRWFGGWTAQFFGRLEMRDADRTVMSCNVSHLISPHVFCAICAHGRRLWFLRTYARGLGAPRVCCQIYRIETPATRRPSRGQSEVGRNTITGRARAV